VKSRGSDLCIDIAWILSYCGGVVIIIAIYSYVQLQVHHNLESANPGSIMATKKVKLSLEISPELNEVLDLLVEKNAGSTKSEVLRKAIALMQVAVEAREQGKKIGIANKDQPLGTELIGI
jgi:predicted transcriptional regulator